MSKQVDERVVSMQFDNKNFERNVQTTLSTLDKLKQSLNLSGATKGLENVDRAAKKVDMTGLANAAETVRAKFSALEVMGVTALANITNSAVNAGKRIVSALTIDPIKTGFQEYETQINAVQTILANTESKGTTLQDVNSALDTLNTYADKTIYNFTEMTRNIGTFTAAGVDLNTSVSAIQGIANLAAVSGSTSQQASTAMYQLSQALSSGTVKLMDWNSVVNAGMGGQVFQDALKQTAKVHGVNIDAMIKKNGSFRETLQEGWLTADILTETLNQFTMAAEEGSEEWNAYKKSLMDTGYSEEQALSILKMANTATDAATKVKTFTQLWDTLKESVQSGWTQSWEIIIGDFGEAKEFLTEISNRVGGMIGSAADARNDMLSGGLSSGWKQLLREGIADEEGYKETLKSVAKEHGVVIDDMIKAEKELDDSLSDSEAFQKALKKGLTEGTLSSDMFSESVHKMSEKMSAMSAEELKAAGYTKEHVTQIKELSDGLKDGSISMDEFVTKMSRTSGRENVIQALWNAFDGLMSVIEPIKEAFREIFPPITGEQLYALTEMLVKFTEKLTLSEKQSDNLKRTFKGVFAVLDIGFSAIKAIGGGLLDLVGYITPVGGGFLDATASIGDFLVKIRDAVKSSNIFGNIIKGIGSFLKPIADGIKTMGKSISDTFGDLMGKAEIRFKPLTVLGNALKAIFVGVGKVISKAMPLIVSLAKGIGSIFSSLMDKISSSIQGADYNGLFDVLNGGIFAAIGAFIAKFIKSGGDILDNAGGILENIKEIIGGVGDALGAFTQQLKAKALKEIATAIAILAGSLFVISMIDSEKLTTSLLAVAALFGELLGSMSLFSKITDGKDVAKIAIISKIMKSLAAALLVLAVAMKIMGSMSWGEMARGLISITVGLGVLVGSINLLPEKKVTNAAKAIRKLSTSMIVLAVALKIMGSMSWKEMGVGLISMATGLGVMVGAVNLLPKDTSKRAAGMIGLSTAMVILGAALKIMSTMSWKEIGAGLVAMARGLALMIGAVNLLPKDAAIKTLGMMGLATSLVILAGALKIMGSMSWKEMGVALITLAGSLTVIAVAMNFMTGALPGAAALLVVAGALAILTPVLKTLGDMSIGEIVKSLLTLAGVFAIIGAAGYLLAPIVPAILGLAGSIALLGVGVLAAGVGVLAFAAGLSALGAALAVSGAGIVAFVVSIISLIPYLLEQIGIGIIKICEVIAGSVDAICAAVTTIVLAVVNALVTCIPAISEGVFKLIVGLLEVLIEYLPRIVPLLANLFVKLIGLMAEALPVITEAVFRFLGVLLDSIATNISQLIEPLVKLFGAIFEGIAAVIGPIVETLIAPILTILKDLLVGLFEAIAPYLPQICAHFENLATIIADAMVRITEAIAPYIPSITEAIQAICDAFVAVAEQIAPVIHEIAGLVESLGEAIENVCDGISDVISSIGDAIEGVLNAVANIFESIGDAALNAGTGFERMANGVKTITKLKLADMAASLAAVATGLGKIAKHADGISKTGTGMKKIADSIKISETSFNKAASGITTMIDKLSIIGPTMTTSIAEFKTGMTSLSTSISSAVVSVQAQTASMTVSIKSMCSSCVSAVKGFSNNMNSAGRYLVSGLAGGIRANKSAATSAAREVASAVESIIRSAWQVNSPSKLFYKIALGVGEGITGAFGDSISGVKRSALDLSDTASDGFRDAMRQIAEFINSDMDTQPTIRPVLDLSEVAAGAGSISGMFGTIPSIDVLSNVRGVGSVMTNRVRNGVNGDVVAALKDLKKTIGNSTGNSYNINGVSVTENSELSDAVRTIVRVLKIEGRS